MPTSNERANGFAGGTDNRELGRRYRIAAEVRFRWQTSAGTWRDGVGTSRDISAYGISVLSSPVPVPGSAIEVSVKLPVTWARSSSLRGSGVVLRLQPESGQPWGFAASVVFDEELHEGLTEAAGESDCQPARLPAPRGP